jgi:hypothetical protein
MEFGIYDDRERVVNDLHYNKLNRFLYKLAINPPLKYIQLLYIIGGWT